MNEPKHEILKNHISEETAYIVNDYPYGFRLRTKIRYWIETTNRGDRFVLQTLNPKTNKWNKPKKSTYCDLMILTKNKENGYINYRSWGVAYTEINSLTKFLEFAGEYPFNEKQKQKIKDGIAIYKTREHIDFKIENITHLSTEEKQKRKEEQEKSHKEIQKIYTYYKNGGGQK